jgi:hypothetical protein
MSFCATCGRQRNGTSRFCAGCGAEFTEPPPAAENSTPGSQAPGDQAQAADAGPPGPPAGVTRTDLDPFSSWYQPAPPAAGNDAGSTWRPTETVNATPAQAAGYATSGFTPGNPFSSANPVMPTAPPFPPGPPPGGPPPGPPARGGRRGLVLLLAVIVVLAAGGGAYALATTLGKHSTAQSGASTPPASSSATGSATGGATQQASSPATSASPTPSPTLSLVAIAPGVPASTAEPQVETLLSHYFNGINTHSYPEYASTLNPAEQAKQTQAEFTSGYSSTTDSKMTLTGLSGTGNGGLTATVTFTSHQSPAQSVDKSACNTWTLNLYLVPQGTGYLIGPAPSGYQPTYSDC